MHVMSVAPLLGEAIHRIHSGLSVGAMFEHPSSAVQATMGGLSVGAMSVG